MRLFVLYGLLIAAAAPARADWPQFLGPNRDSVSPDRDIAKLWPQAGPPVKWTVATGKGFGGASILGDEVFLLDRDGEAGDVLRVFDLKTGAERWKYAYDAKGKLQYHGSRSTPTVDAEHVYTVGCLGDLHCISRETRKPVWTLNLQKKWKDAKLNWGFAQSPLLYKDTVIVTPTHAEAPILVALNKKTGEIVWESPAKDPNGKYGSDYYSSPVIRTVCGVQGLLQITNNQVSFINPDDGRLIWKYNGYSVKFAIPAPTVLPDGEHVFITGGYDDGSVMIQVTKKDDAYTIEEKFRFKSDGCQIHPPVYFDKYLYANINENSKFNRAGRVKGGLACIDPVKGEIVWRTGDDPFFSRGAVLLVGNLLLVLEGDKGTLHLIQPNPTGYHENARFKVLAGDGEQVWAPMAYSKGLLIVRDQNQMKCVDLTLGRRLSVAE
jgi:outer membrane protein assembly factor BamB